MNRPSRRARSASRDDAPLPRGARPPRPRASADEHPAFERRQPARPELVDGDVYARAGTVLPHNRIGGNVLDRISRGNGGGPRRWRVRARALRTPAPEAAPA